MKKSDEHIDGKTCRDSSFYDWEREGYVRCQQCMLEDFLDSYYTDFEVVFNLNFTKIK